MELLGGRMGPSAWAPGGRGHCGKGAWGGGFMGGRLWRMGQVWVPPTPTKCVGGGRLAGPAPQRSWALSRLALLSQDLWTEIVGD